MKIWAWEVLDGNQFNADDSPQIKTGRQFPDLDPVVLNISQTYPFPLAKKKSELQRILFGADGNNGLDKVLLVVAAAGVTEDENGGAPFGSKFDAFTDCNAFPACWTANPAGPPRGLISVVALDAKGTEVLSDPLTGKFMSNYGSAFDVAAVGEVTTTEHGGWFGKVSGSSVAAPYVTGLAALLFAKTATKLFRAQVQEVKNRILFTADELDSISRYGRINFERALNFEDDWLRNVPSAACGGSCRLTKVRIMMDIKSSIRVVDGILENGDKVPQIGIPISFKELKSLRRRADDTFTITYLSGDRLIRIVKATAESDANRIVKVRQPDTGAETVLPFDIKNVAEYVSCSWYNYC